jgi:hypothetical protein
LANREFHKKNIKEKAAHLASMFGHGDFPQVKPGPSESSGTQELDIQPGSHEPASTAWFPSSSSFSDMRSHLFFKPLKSLRWHLKRTKCKDSR